MKYRDLLIDAKNSIYRAVYAAKNDKKFIESGHNYLVVFFRVINKYRVDFSPSRVHVFWDSPSGTIWRNSIMEGYKAGRSSDVDIGECADKAKEIMSHMGFYQYYADTMEADDLIYAWCKLNDESKAVIVSSDGDMAQISYKFKNVDVYNPLLNRLAGKSDIDPIEVKCFCGDKSDAISGYRGVGDVKVRKLLLSADSRVEFFEKYGAETYERNKKLIDLSLCPGLDQNVEYIKRVMSVKPVFDGEPIKKIIFRIRGLTQEYPSRILPFKFLE